MANRLRWGEIPHNGVGRFTLGLPVGDYVSRPMPRTTDQTYALESVGRGSMFDGVALNCEQLSDSLRPFDLILGNLGFTCDE